MENGTEKKQKEGLHSGTAKFEESQNTKKNNGNTKNEGTVYLAVHSTPKHRAEGATRRIEKPRREQVGGSNPGWNSGGLGGGRTSFGNLGSTRVQPKTELIIYH